MKLIERKQYLDKMINVIGTPDIKVITGVRRCGKSKLLDAFREYIEENIHINEDSHTGTPSPGRTDLRTRRHSSLQESVPSSFP